MLKNQKRTISVLGLAAVLSCATTAFAAAVVSVTCINEKCGYEDALDIGRGMRFDQVSGYCEHDKKFVFVTWNIGDKAPEPVRVWNTALGRFIELYKCPNDGDLFMPIPDIKQLKYCPKYHQPTLEAHVTGAVD